MADADLAPPHDDLAGYVLGTLDPAAATAFERHLAGCARCRTELQELGGLPALLALDAHAPDEPVVVPAGMEARVLGAVRREAAGGPARRRAARPASRPRRWRWSWAATPWALGAAAAVALAFVAGLGVGHALLPGPVGRPATTIQLAAADGGTASGVATIRPEDRGHVIELSVQNLPPPPAGHFYTCWLVADDDTAQRQDRVSVGSFTTSLAGRATVRWQTAADLTRYPHLGVTLEPDNGNPLHQGPKVLAAA